MSFHCAPFLDLPNPLTYSLMSLLFHCDKQGVRVSVHKREFAHKITRQRNELTSSKRA